MTDMPRTKKRLFFDNLVDYKYAVTTDNDLAQTYFNQGLILAYAKLNDDKKVAEIREQLKDVWSAADIELTNARIK